MYLTWFSQMFQQVGESVSRKRGREGEDDEPGPLGYQVYPTKRRIASLPLRRSPEHNRRVLPTFETNCIPPKSPSFADITPTESESDDIPSTDESRSFISPWSLPLDRSIPSSLPGEPRPSSSTSTQTHISAAYSDDLEMADSGLLHPGPFQPDPSSTSIASRIPTPIHTQFASYVHASNKTSRYHDESTLNTITNNYTSDGSVAESTQSHHSRRLPSPISEDGATSPSLLPQSLSDVQMEGEGSSDLLPPEEPKMPQKKGHTRSKHMLGNWGGHGLGSDMAGVGIRRGFSMGYRSDCEKCRMRVPGHFSHVITY